MMCWRPKQTPQQQAVFLFQRRPPPPPIPPHGSPIAEHPWGELILMFEFGFRAFLWSSLPSNRQGALPGPPDGCGIPNSSSSRELIGASPLSTLC